MNEIITDNDGLLQDREEDNSAYERRDVPLSRKILRFRKSERSLHWALAIPFLVCLVTALILVIYYNPDPQRPYRAFFSWTHRISGIFLIFLPFIAVVRSRGDHRIFFYNIRQAWIWTMEDLKWLSLMELAAVSKKFVLPEQGKFNAAEKINFMNLMATYPLYILTGLLVWLTDVAFISWLLHFLMALIVLPLIGGHIYMALINPSSRIGLEGMITGFVDRQWAKHHYTRWYREHFEDEDVSDTEE
jgi:formate dehydrogenase subunit gamma